VGKASAVGDMVAGGDGADDLHVLAGKAGVLHHGAGIGARREHAACQNGAGLALGKSALVHFAHGSPRCEAKQRGAGLACAEAVAGMDGVAVDGRAVEAGQVCRCGKVFGKHPAKTLVEGKNFAFPQGEAPEGGKHFVHGLQREKRLHLACRPSALPVGQGRASSVGVGCRQASPEAVPESRRA